MTTGTGGPADDELGKALDNGLGTAPGTAPGGAAEDAPTDDAVAAALAPLVNGLAADDYRLDITRTGPHAVTLTVVAGPAACADCLVPQDITRRMAEQRLAAVRRAPWEVEVRYP